MGAELHHEAGDDAEEARVVVESAPHQLVEAVGAPRGPAAVGFDDKRSLACLEAGEEDGWRAGLDSRLRESGLGPGGAIAAHEGQRGEPHAIQADREEGHGGHV